MGAIGLQKKSEVVLDQEIEVDQEIEMDQEIEIELEADQNLQDQNQEVKAKNKRQKIKCKK